MQNCDGTAYKIYTTAFDKVVDAGAIDSVLGKLSLSHGKSVDAAWDQFQFGLLPWKSEAHLLASAADTTIRNKLTQAELNDTAVTLLVDQSGSMRGQKMLYAAASLDVLQEFLLTLGITCEVLGFTTSTWKGGLSRRRWRWRFKPRNPGRLNDILHIIYRHSSDRRASAGGWPYRIMLRPDLPKENIDGEAIEWAASRLRKLPNTRKILVVLSDGAPVDDSTILANSNSYLWDHLDTVVEAIGESGDIELGGLGICYDVSSLYPIHAIAEAPAQIAKTLFLLLEKMILSMPGEV